MNLITLNLAILLVVPLAIAEDSPLLYKCQSVDTLSITYQDFPCGSAKVVTLKTLPKVESSSIASSFPRVPEVPIGYYQKRIGSIGHLLNPEESGETYRIVMPELPPSDNRVYIPHD